jgi:outer membrane protein assembly factor BamB
MPVAVTTRAYDNTRGGANTGETVLTASAVESKGIVRLFSLRTQGDLRGTEAQPLFVPGVTLADGRAHDVIYVATMANRVYAFDAQDGSQLWERALGTPVTGNRTIDSWLINDHWGILSTPVIDVPTDTMYAVAWISPDGSVAKAEHFLYAISIKDGSDVNPAVSLEGTTYDPGHGLPVQQFRSAARKQRVSLLLTSVNGVSTVFVGFGTIAESSDTARGWIIACGTAPPQVSAAWTSTAKGSGGGLWQAGAGLVADDQGFIYAMTGNGDFDGVTDFGESFVKLRYQPAQGTSSASLQLVDWWAPWTDKERTVGALARVAEAAALPSNFRAYAAGMGADWGDMDLGSGGPVLVPSAGAVLGAGKDGVLYVLDMNAMGKTTPAALANPAANYAKLKSPPIFFTFYPGPALSPAPANIQVLNVFWANRTHHQHGSPVHWDSPDLGPVLYCWGENGNLRAWSVAADGKVRYLACGAEVASAQSPPPYGGMPGGMLTLSANGAEPHTGVVWATIPYGNANTAVTNGRLLAYDATQFGTYADGSKQLRVIWDSQAEGLPFLYNKFNPPVVANGRVLVPTYDGGVDVYGLL